MRFGAKESFLQPKHIGVCIEKSHVSTGNPKEKRTSPCEHNKESHTTAIFWMTLNRSPA